MIGNIRKSFINMVDQSTWMDEMSKNKAIEKVRINKKNNMNKISFLGFSNR
jgi:hypothetical protein